ncbi:MAG: hypothetical protein ACI9P5_004622, partial [Saprospiraceae bacterium]
HIPAAIQSKFEHNRTSMAIFQEEGHE